MRLGWLAMEWCEVVGVCGFGMVIWTHSATQLAGGVHRSFDVTTQPTHRAAGRGTLPLYLQ
jgi:hypothetical protein